MCTVLCSYKQHASHPIGDFQAVTFFPLFLPTALGILNNAQKDIVSYFYALCSGYSIYGVVFSFSSTIVLKLYACDYNFLQV